MVFHLQRKSNFVSFHRPAAVYLLVVPEDAESKWDYNWVSGCLIMNHIRSPLPAEMLLFLGSFLSCLMTALEQITVIWLHLCFHSYP